MSAKESINPTIDETHNPNLRSWVESANQKDTDFPIQNLPVGVFRRRNELSPRLGVAIGDQILDLAAVGEVGLLAELSEDLQAACGASNLNSMMALGRESALLLRRQISQLLRYNSDSSPPESKILLPISEAQLLLPASIGDYTDFYASIFHATNVGKLFRPDNPLLPNYKYIPVAYHGRASSIVASGTPIRRPVGQSKRPEESVPSFAASKLLDYEVEVGLFVGAGNALGESITIDRAEDHIFGLCLVNDWSARDIQAWEYQPLGPFLGKSFATTISPWVVTLDALAPFRCAAMKRNSDDPAPLAYLACSTNSQFGGINLTVEVLLHSVQMREMGIEPLPISRASFTQMYWTIAQMVTHHTSNGCNLRSGDLLASGTVSGADEGSQGSLLEITRRGEQPIQLPSGETRSFLADGDEVILRGYCEKEGYVKIGFGECRGKIFSY
ncbi:fumarylacetoacetase [Gloeothece verrucosa]|uniref:fumarylacetoacetase n=1 Tax=Gloeothece verrucosa (strain PCC 7822) TaxID=497965 RepID=E0U9B8_GLOV7|nr:fumarylacetoacetase [Gloeothece verrucosa]ADN12610.1 fumarylacetoacetase [Gloeothece verrucosa PCC 7822]